MLWCLRSSVTLDVAAIEQHNLHDNTIQSLQWRYKEWAPLTPLLRWNGMLLYALRCSGQVCGHDNCLPDQCTVKDSLQQDRASRDMCRLHSQPSAEQSCKADWLPRSNCLLLLFQQILAVLALWHSPFPFTLRWQISSPCCPCSLPS